MAVSQHTVTEINRYATGAMTPDVTVVLTSMSRWPGRAVRTAERSVDRMESAPDGFQQAVRASFLAQAEAAPERHLVIDATQPADVITQQVLEHLRTRLGVQL